MFYKRVFEYDPITGRATNLFQVERDSEESAWPVIANTTDIEPPFQQGHIAFFFDGQWTLVEQAPIEEDTETTIPQTVPSVWMVAEGDGYRPIFDGSIEHQKILLIEESKRPSLFEDNSPNVNTWRLNVAKSEAVKRVNSFVVDIRAKIAGTADTGELAGYTNKKQIAERIVANVATQNEIQAFLDEIDERNIGESLQTFTQKVLINAVVFSRAVAKIDGIKKRVMDSVSSAKSPEDINGILLEAKARASNAMNGVVSLKQAYANGVLKP